MNWHEIVKYSPQNYDSNGNRNKLQFIGESAAVGRALTKPLSTIRLCFSSLRQFLYVIYGLMRTSSHAHICHK